MERIFLFFIASLLMSKAGSEELFLENRLTYSEYEVMKEELFDSFRCDSRSKYLQQKEFLTALMYTERKGDFELRKETFLKPAVIKKIRLEALDKGDLDIYNEEPICITKNHAYISSYNVIKTTGMDGGLGWAFVFKIDFSEKKGRLYLNINTDYFKESKNYYVLTPVSSFHARVDFQYVND
jgi:hypothetical protein